MQKRKSIVLSDTKNKTNKKAVLTMQEDGVGITGSLRLYNFSGEPLGVSSLGFYVEQKVYKAGLTKKANMLYEFFLDLQTIPIAFSCAVVNFQNAVATPILYGASDGNDDEIYANIIAQMSNDNSMKNAEKLLDDNGVDFDDEEKKIIEKEIDDAMCENCDNCTNCVYKKYFYEHQSGQEVASEALSEKPKDDGFVVQAEEETDEEEAQSDNAQEDVEQKEEKIDTDLQESAFIDRLKPQIDKLFEKNPIENNLQSLIPNSKWVKIEYEDDGDFYVFGLLYDDEDQVQFVCYGVPAVFEEEPPKELSGYPIWLPLDKENQKGFGYWLTYQDATTGEPVKAILD